MQETPTGNLRSRFKPLAESRMNTKFRLPRETMLICSFGA